MKKRERQKPSLHEVLLEMGQAIIERLESEAKERASAYCDHPNSPCEKCVESAPPLGDNPLKGDFLVSQIYLPPDK
jgi:hypothetical protein